MRRTVVLSSLLAILVIAWTLNCGDDGGAPAVTCIDNDGDTYGQNCSAGTDCDDNDPNNWTKCYTCMDSDIDGFYINCNRYLTINGPDCDDSDGMAYPGATEVCDDDLEACGGVADAGCNGDGDYYCDDTMNVVGSPAVCSGESGGEYPGRPGTDCDDGDESIYPGVPEVCRDGIDQNCDESLICDGGTVDSDGDEYASMASGGTDCNDNDLTVYPGAIEICDSIDNQCPGDAGYETVDEGFGGPCGPMTQIPEGCFDMGDSSDSCIYDDECPVHNVCITSSFYMDIHEVTNAEYKTCVDAGECSAPGNSDSWTRTSYYGNPTYGDYPVIYVNWNQATAYCSWAGKRLPTEAEWEYAARGGLSGKRYPWGDSIACADACYGRYSSLYNCWDYGGLDNDTHPVGSYSANGYGLYDMAGNVWEWVNDWYQSDYYSVSPTNDPPGPASGTYRVLRGGSWTSLPPLYLRVADRFNFDPALQGGSLGFRCVRD